MLKKPDVGYRTDTSFFRRYHPRRLEFTPNEMGQLMNNGNEGSSLILVMEDVEETRDGIEKLLQVDGYRVDPARNEEDAIRRATRECPDLILISPGGLGIPLYPKTQFC